MARRSSTSPTRLPTTSGSADDSATRRPRVARRERLPIGALAAASAAVVLFAAFFALRPADNAPLTAATPGAETTTTLASDATAEDLVVASFQRWVDGRTEAERVTNRLINDGYDVVIRRLNVAERSLNGQVLAIRHGIGNNTGTTIAQPRRSGHPGDRPHPLRRRQPRRMTAQCVGEPSPTSGL